MNIQPLTIQNLVNNAQCYEVVRALRWPDGVRCPHCQSPEVNKRGKDESQPERQRYACNACARRFDDLTGTVLAGHHQPLKTWVVCLYFMGLNLSNSQIAQELGLNVTDVQQMTEQLREGIEQKKKPLPLVGEIEADEVYIVAGHKGQPAAVQAQGRKGRRRRLKGARGRGTKAKEKPPVLGLIQRGGEVVIRLLDNVKQVTIKPVIEAMVQAGSLIYTDEYRIYDRLPQWGYGHQSVNHSQGEYARDDDGDDFCEVHVNTMEGFWSLLRSWLRPHRGISQAKLPLYLSFFEFVHNARVRGKQLLPELIRTLVT